MITFLTVFSLFFFFFFRRFLVVFVSISSYSSQNPWVPLGSMFTAGVLASGLFAFYKGKQSMSQNMMVGKRFVFASLRKRNGYALSLSFFFFFFFFFFFLCMCRHNFFLIIFCSVFVSLLREPLLLF